MAVERASDLGLRTLRAIALAPLLHAGFSATGDKPPRFVYNCSRFSHPARSAGAHPAPAPAVVSATLAGLAPSVHPRQPARPDVSHLGGRSPTTHVSQLGGRSRPPRQPAPPPHASYLG